LYLIEDQNLYKEALG